MDPIQELRIARHILDKIESRHGVRLAEVHQACSGPHLIRRGREDTYLLFGRTDAGRYLLVVLAPRGAGVYYIATARTMTANERDQYRRHVRG